MFIDPECTPTTPHFDSAAGSLPSGSLVICTRNRPQLLRSCLLAAQKLNHRPNEILIVDNSSGAPETRSLAEEFNARYVIEPLVGLSHARNRGIADAQSEIVVFLDDDALPCANWFGLILRAFDDASVAAVAGRILTPDSDTEPFAAESPRSLNQNDPLWLEIASFGGMGLGGNMALRKSACDRSAFFDVRLGRGAPFQIAEEHFAFAYLIARGHTVLYLPDAIVFHPSLFRAPVALEARNSIAYFLLLLSEFPSQRAKLLQFLLRRLRRKPLPWARATREPGDIITSSWFVKVTAALAGLWLFVTTPKPPTTN